MSKNQQQSLESAVPILYSQFFMRVKASGLKPEDDFMKFTPRTKPQERLMAEFLQVITDGLGDFWAAYRSPRFNKTGTGISCERGFPLAHMKPYPWWDEAAKNFLPEHESRLGRKNEWIALIAYLIKAFSSYDLPVETMWEVVCGSLNPIKTLTPYMNDKTYKNVPFDIIRTLLERPWILTKGNGRFWIASGGDFGGSTYAWRFSLSDLSDLRPVAECYEHCGWIVFK